jgi:predicted hotdog family 3-hydroxylacyl-ACP dehydratase
MGKELNGITDFHEFGNNFSRLKPSFPFRGRYEITVTFLRFRYGPLCRFRSIMCFSYCWTTANDPDHMAATSLTQKVVKKSQSALPTDVTLEDLLPHRSTMLLVDEIVELDSTHAVALNTVAGTWPLTDQDGASPLILIELAAQTAGVCNGWDRIQQAGRESDQMGWLVAVKRADFFVEHLPIGMAIRVRAENSFAFEKFREVTSQIYHLDHLLAEVVLQLYQP